MVESTDTLVLQIVKVLKKLNTKNIKDFKRNTEEGLKFFKLFNSLSLEHAMRPLIREFRMEVRFTHTREVWSEKISADLELARFLISEPEKLYEKKRERRGTIVAKII